MMNPSEVQPGKYRHLFYLNGLMSIPLFIIFAWPYVILSQLVSIRAVIFYPGAILFSLPFVLTILSRHAVFALGSVQRNMYYDWLQDHPLTYGLLFHPILTRTHFRLALLTISIILFTAGALI